MSAGTTDEDKSQSSPPPARDAGGEPGAGVANSAGDLLDHFDRIVTMIELIGRLPDLAEDVRNWRPRRLVESFSRRPRRRSDRRLWRARPVARNAFDAVVAGLDMLGSAAVAICENAGGRLSPEEIAACREIGVVMAGLLERARALIETAGASRFRAVRARADRPFLQNRVG